MLEDCPNETSWEPFKATAMHNKRTCISPLSLICAGQRQCRHKVEHAGIQLRSACWGRLCSHKVKPLQSLQITEQRGITASPLKHRTDELRAKISFPVALVWSATLSTAVCLLVTKVNWTLHVTGPDSAPAGCYLLIAALSFFTHPPSGLGKLFDWWATMGF